MASFPRQTARLASAAARAVRLRRWEGLRRLAARRAHGLLSHKDDRRYRGAKRYPAEQRRLPLQRAECQVCNSTTTIGAAFPLVVRPLHPAGPPGCRQLHRAWSGLHR